MPIRFVANRFTDASVMAITKAHAELRLKRHLETLEPLGEEFRCLEIKLHEAILADSQPEAIEVLKSLTNVDSQEAGFRYIHEGQVWWIVGGWVRQP